MSGEATNHVALSKLGSSLASMKNDPSPTSLRTVSTASISLDKNMDVDDNDLEYFTSLCSVRDESSYYNLTDTSTL